MHLTFLIQILVFIFKQLSIASKYFYLIFPLIFKSLEEKITFLTKPIKIIK